MKKSVLYCGDTDLSGAASYLAGLMTAWGWNFDYVSSGVAVTSKLLEIPRNLLILSDYPASQFDAGMQERALLQIERGCGLLMIGGWESFHGFGGNWDQTKLGAALPVEIAASDDRVNFEQSAFLVPTCDHEITKDLPWVKSPPAIGGMNRVRPKPDGTIVLNAYSYSVSIAENPMTTLASQSNLLFTCRETLPALVVGQYGAGRTAAFTSDVAPHWVGGLVDWGLPRFSAEAGNSIPIEVGCYYAQFWRQLLQWTAFEG